MEWISLGGKICEAVYVYIPGTICYWPDHVGCWGSNSSIIPKPAICIISLRASSFCVYILRNSTNATLGLRAFEPTSLLGHHYAGLSFKLVIHNVIHCRTNKKRRNLTLLWNLRIWLGKNRWLWNLIFPKHTKITKL